MITFWVIAVVMAAVSLAALRREVRRDGYGSRPRPRSRYDEIDPRFAHR